MMTMNDSTYRARRGQLQTYFDRTAIEAWKRFAGDQPLSRIRETVRRGRAEMRAAMLSALPEDLSGWRILDAGCGTGAMSAELARRGADVVGVDLSPQTVRFAHETLPALARGSVRFVAGDMLARGHGRFDAVMAMDSLIHYRTADAVSALETFAERAGSKIIFTFAPRTPLLAAMHVAGKLFPKGDRAPAIVPVAPARLQRLIAGAAGLDGWRIGGSARVASGFYTSQMMELERS